MNKKDDVVRRAKLNDNAVVNFWDHEGQVVVHGDSYRHFLIKSAFFKVLQEAGHDVATEVTFENGKVADVVDFTDFNVIEIETNATSGDRKEKLENFKHYDVNDIFVFDPTEFPTEFKELKQRIKEELPNL